MDKVHQGMFSRRVSKISSGDMRRALRIHIIVSGQCRKSNFLLDCSLSGEGHGRSVVEEGPIDKNRDRFSAMEVAAQ